MTENKQDDNILAALDSTVQDALEYFDKNASVSRVRIGDWGAWEVLCHFIFWHEATIKGMESVSRGGDFYRLEANADTLNDRIISHCRGYNFSQLTTRLRELEKQLQQAANNMPSLDAPVLQRTNGTLLSGRERLQMISQHWARHMEELRTGEPSCALPAKLPNTNASTSAAHVVVHGFKPVQFPDKAPEGLHYSMRVY